MKQWKRKQKIDGCFGILVAFLVATLLRSMLNKLIEKGVRAVERKIRSGKRIIWR